MKFYLMATQIHINNSKVETSAQVLSFQLNFINGLAYFAGKTVTKKEKFNVSIDTSLVMVAAEVFDLVKSMAESLPPLGVVFSERSSGFGAPREAWRLSSRAAISRFTAFSSFILSELSELCLAKPPDLRRKRTRASRTFCFTFSWFSLFTKFWFSIETSFLGFSASTFKLASDFLGKCRSAKCWQTFEVSEKDSSHLGQEKGAGSVCFLM